MLGAHNLRHPIDILIAHLIIFSRYYHIARSKISHQCSVENTAGLDFYHKKTGFWKQETKGSKIEYDTQEKRLIEAMEVLVPDLKETLPIYSETDINRWGSPLKISISMSEVGSIIK